MLAAITSATLFGVDGQRVVVEVHISNGLPGFTVVGLPDAACREARDRVRAALLSAQLPWPQRRVTVNLAPSGLRKAGSGLDLPIAVGVLVAMGELTRRDVVDCGFVGELGLDGSIRPVPGVLPLVAAMTTGAVVVPLPNVEEAALCPGTVVRAARSISELVGALRGSTPWPDESVRGNDMLGWGELPHDLRTNVPDLADVRGQPLARTALEVAAAGGHHLLMVGPPGSGKTMLAERLVGLLPPLDGQQRLETSRIFSAAGLGLPAAARTGRPPYRAPHHSATAVAVIGGGTSTMRPGEVSLASNGVLFLDELGEFQTAVLECLRQPLEEGVVRVARARGTVEFPASFLLVAAMNPCPCALGSKRGACRCSDQAIHRYRRRLSGPLLDRFDLHVGVERPETASLFGGSSSEPTAVVAARVAAARQRAARRGVRSNSEIPAERLNELAPLSAEARRIFERRMERGDLSARGLARARRVAQTIDDLTGREGPVSAEAAVTSAQLRQGRALFGDDGECAA